MSETKVTPPLCGQLSDVQSGPFLSMGGTGGCPWGVCDRQQGPKVRRAVLDRDVELPFRKFYVEVRENVSECWRTEERIAVWIRNTVFPHTIHVSPSSRWNLPSQGSAPSTAGYLVSSSGLASSSGSVRVRVTSGPVEMFGGKDTVLALVVVQI